MIVSALFPGAGAFVWLYGIKYEKDNPSPDWEEDLFNNKLGIAIGTLISLVAWGAVFTGGLNG